MKIIYKTNKKIENANAFLFGLKGFSTLDNEICLDELDKFSDKEVFLSIDKNIFNKDLEPLEKVLKDIDNYNLKGILFYDLSILSLAKKHLIKTPLIWNQNFLTVNYKTCNFYEKEGIKGVVVPPVITLEEIVEIKENVNRNTSIIVPCFGYQMIAFSKRYLVSNYFKYIKEESDEDINYMIEREESYPISEIKEGTKIYSKDVLNVIKYVNILKRKGIDYIILDDFLIEDDVFKKISDLFEDAVNNNLSDKVLSDYESLIKAFIPNTSEHFFNKKTIYKVKRK